MCTGAVIIVNSILVNSQAYYVVYNENSHAQGKAQFQRGVGWDGVGGGSWVVVAVSALRARVGTRLC